MSNLRYAEAEGEFITLIENFDDLDIYKRFLASVIIYRKIEYLDDSNDKFLYLCIAIEATSNRENKSTRFKKFFKENLNINDRIKIVSSFKDTEFKYKADSAEVILHQKDDSFKPRKIKEKNFLPSCYKLRQCYLEYSDCNPNYGCYLKNKGNTNGYLDKVLDFLYQKRSNFVHDGKIFIHPEDDNVLPFVYYVKGIPLPVRYSLDINDLFILYEKALLSYFND